MWCSSVSLARIALLAPSWCLPIGLVLDHKVIAIINNTFQRLLTFMRLFPMSSVCLSIQVYSMNLEVVTRMAPMELTISPKLLSPLADFLHSSKVRYVSLLVLTRLKHHIRIHDKCA